MDIHKTINNCQCNWVLADLIQLVQSKYGFISHPDIALLG